jgi:hypothetical protein
LKNTRNVNYEQLSGYKGPDESTSKRKMLTREKCKGTNTLHKPLNQTTTKSGPHNNDSTKEILTLKRSANEQTTHLLRQPTQDSKYPGILYTKT